MWLLMMGLSVVIIGILQLYKFLFLSDIPCIHHMVPLKKLHPAPEGQLVALHGQKWTRMIGAQWRYEMEGSIRREALQNDKF